MPLKIYKNIEGEGRVEFTTQDFADLQNFYIKKIIRHNHSNIPAIHVRIGELGDETPPVGIELPTTEGEIVSWQDHVNLDHSASFGEGKLIARGYTVPIRTRFIITTPILDTTSRVPFPTYNMSNIAINKDISSSDSIQEIPSNRQHPSTYSIYRHYLYALPANGVSQIHPAHHAILESDLNTVIFAKNPLYIHPSNTSLLENIMDYDTAPNFRHLDYLPDYAEEKIWSLTEDSTCWLGGYKTIVSNDKIILLFNDYYNEFNQVLSLVNYEEMNRQYFFRWEKAAANITTENFHNLSAITRLMAAKSVDVMAPNVGAGFVRDAINKSINPFSIADYNISIDKDTSRVKQSLLESCVDKSGNNITLFPKGLYNFSGINSNTFLKELEFPAYFEDGFRQCLVINADLGTSKKSFKKLHKGRIMMVYQMIDGYMTIPYEIYSSPEDIAERSIETNALTGRDNRRVYHDVTKMGNIRSSG